jgi:hypothetical protein
MDLCDRELLFLDIFLKYKKNYDYVMNKSLKYEILLTKYNLISKITKIEVYQKYNSKEYNFIPIGYIDRNKFTWINGMNKIFYDHFIKYKFNKLYMTKELVNYLFNDEIFLNSKYKYIIPYIISFTNPSYNVIEFIDINNVKFFCLINLKIKDHVKYEKKFLNILKEMNCIPIF